MTAAPPIYNLDPVQRLTAIKYLILEISVITGWPVPQAEVKNILVKEFENLLMESFPLINVQEIGLAFRKYGTRIKDWGKEMNLSLITAVLDSYWEERTETKQSSNLGLLNQPETHIWTDEEMDNEIRGKIQAYLDYKWEGKKNPLWIEHWGEVLVKDGFIRDITQVDDFLSYLFEKQIKLIYEKSN